jgi:hypothetical protein
VASEILPDVLSGLVAAGTLALAGMTFYVGRAASRAAIDATSPRVVVTSLSVHDLPHNRPGVRGAQRPSIQAGLSWSLTQHGRDLIGMRAGGDLYNESLVTALLRLEPGPDCEIGGVTAASSGMPTIFTRLPQQGEWHVLYPGARAQFLLYWWQSADAWAEAWQRHDRYEQLPPPVTTARLIVRGASGEAEDQCDLTFGGYVVVRHPREDGWVIGAVDADNRGIPGSVPPRVTTIGLMRRSYRQAAWLRRARSLRMPGRSVLRAPRRRRALPAGQPPEAGSP